MDLTLTIKTLDFNVAHSMGVSPEIARLDCNGHLPFWSLGPHLKVRFYHFHPFSKNDQHFRQHEFDMNQHFLPFDGWFSCCLGRTSMQPQGSLSSGGWLPSQSEVAVLPMGEEKCGTRAALVRKDHRCQGNLKV